MSKNGDGSRKGAAWLVGILLVFALNGCGDSGDQGEQGPEGPAGPTGGRSEAPESITATITDVSVNSAPVVKFRLEDSNGYGFRGVEEGEASFTIAKLLGGANGETNHWRSYIWHADGGKAGGTSEIKNAQAYNESSGTLENHGDGTYTYTFATDITSGVERYNHSTGQQEVVDYEPDLPHRVGMEIRSSFNDEEVNADAVYTFKPSSGEEVTAGRKIVDRKSCNQCHGDLAAHGGGRFQPDYCVTCHQPGSRDVESGSTMDFRVMVHKLHMGKHLPSVASGGDYEFCGHGCEHYGAPMTSFNQVAFPQDIRGPELGGGTPCTKCHNPAETGLTPQASNIKEKPTRAACGSCHTDVNFADGTNHPGGAQSDDSNCTSCHSEGGSAGPVLTAHRYDADGDYARGPDAMVVKRAAGKFQLTIHSISNTSPGSTPTVTYSIAYDTDGSGSWEDSERLDVLGPASRLDSANGASVNLDLAWSTDDYTNVDGSGGVTGDAPSQPVSMSLLADNSGNITDNGDGTFTVTSTQAIPGSGVTGSGAAVIEGHPADHLDTNGDGTQDTWTSIPATSQVEFFPITDSSAQARRSVVDIAKCQGCHGENDGLAMHGANRTDNVQVCVVCHNPNQTDLAMRPADPDGTEDDANADALDGKEERSIDFKFLIHAIHGAGKRSSDLVVYGYPGGDADSPSGESGHNFSHTHFPRSSSDCLACHKEGTYQLPLGDNVLASTLDTDATVETQGGDYGPNAGASSYLPGDGSASDPTDDGNASATASVCRACHDSDSAASHMITTGNATLPDPATGTYDTYLLDQATLDSQVEACATCHGPGGTAAVSKVHGVD